MTREQLTKATEIAYQLDVKKRELEAINKMLHSPHREAMISNGNKSAVRCDDALIIDNVLDAMRRNKKEEITELEKQFEQL